jgi:hypothetical protein
MIAAVYARRSQDQNLVWSKNSIRGPGARPGLADRPRSEILR